MKLHLNTAFGVVQGLEQILKEKKALRPTLNQLLKQNRKWGSRDRKWVGEGVLEIIRWQRKFSEMGALDLKSEFYFWNLLGIWILSNKISLPKWDQFEELNLKEINLNLNPKTTPRKILQSLPDWLDSLGVEIFGKTTWEKEIQSLNTTAPLVLRVNTLKTTPKKLQSFLEKKYQIESAFISELPGALILKKHQKLTHTEPFKLGWFEIQDTNSQQVALFANPQPGMSVIDACAGAGGKTLHLAAIMQNKGKIIAMDPYEKKLEQLKARVKRNGVRIVLLENSGEDDFLETKKGTADLVLIDAPCSGLGVLRRNPAAKWHMTPKRIEELVVLQQDILQTHATLVNKGGALVYATCSLLPDENQNQIQHFLNSDAGVGFQLDKEQTLLTHNTQGDGFYMAKMTKIS
ncbi:RsmB/NOP family class I SAM-dependent RNA methyltransferase [Flavobacteriaceae bacterium]|jgi:16S rRNA (cytosine967-C5)-methyltransferase|nr:RsmB/NOP family class I SAM-dependent RNA methyltransferase [Flavobacteriaceae bacterium]